MPGKKSQEILIDVAQQAPAPSKDYVHLKVDHNELVFTRIIINPRCMQFPVAPQTLRLSLEEFNEDCASIQTKIEHYFPQYVDRVRLICDGHHDSLTILPQSILINICKNLEPQDIVAELSNVSKPLRDLCQSDKLWQALYDTHITDTANMSQEMRELAVDIGWKKFYFSRVINTRRGAKKIPKGPSARSVNQKQSVH